MFLVLGIQHAMRMRHIVICNLFVLQCFSTLFHKRHEYSRILSKMYIGLHVKYSLFLSDFNETSIFSKDFRKILEYKISWKFVQWEPSFSVWTDGQTDTTKLIVAFRNFANAPKYGYFQGAKIIVPQTTKTVPQICGNLMFIAVLTTA